MIFIRVDTTLISINTNILDIQDIFVLIDFGVLFMEINIQDISLDRNWSSIIVDRYPRHIHMNKYLNISVDKIQDIFT